MKPESPGIDQDTTVAPYAQEIEYALILSRMINAVNNDPAQIRSTIYEYARAKLKLDTSWAQASERERLAAALETAIQGVEAFSMRQDERARLEPPAPAARIGRAAPSAAPPSTSMATVGPVSPAPEDILVPERAYPYAEVRHILEVRTSPLVPMLARFCVGMLLFGAVAGLAYYRQKLFILGERAGFFQLGSSAVTEPPATPDTQQASGPGEAKSIIPSPAAPPFPLPSDYGVYALNNGALSELQLLPGQVPDKRIAMSTPIDQPSRTTLPDGKAKFVVFRRDLLGNAPDRIEVRVVARVVRALTFDAKGKPSLVPVSDAWNIRNISYEFRVRPIPGNPEMLLVQSEKPDFALPAGRYVLALKGEGYDFTIAGNVTDLSQCLERTNAANGAFYSECQKL
jgi:hypothetical protein